MDCTAPYPVRVLYKNILLKYEGTLQMLALAIYAAVQYFESVETCLVVGAEITRQQSAYSYTGNFVDLAAG